jgi:hypothetical protein
VNDLSLETIKLVTYKDIWSLVAFQLAHERFRIFFDKLVIFPHHEIALSRLIIARDATFETVTEKWLS